MDNILNMGFYFIAFLFTIVFTMGLIMCILYLIMMLIEAWNNLKSYIEIGGNKDNG